MAANRPREGRMVSKNPVHVPQSTPQPLVAQLPYSGETNSAISGILKIAGAKMLAGALNMFQALAPHIGIHLGSFKVPFRTPYHALLS